MSDEPIEQVRVKNREIVSGIDVEDIIKFRDMTQETLDEFEEETGHRVAICVMDWALHPSAAKREPAILHKNGVDNQ